MRCLNCPRNVGNFRKSPCAQVATHPKLVVPCEFKALLRSLSIAQTRHVNHRITDHQATPSGRRSQLNCSAISTSQRISAELQRAVPRDPMDSSECHSAPPKSTGIFYARLAGRGFGGCFCFFDSLRCLSRLPIVSLRSYSVSNPSFGTSRHEAF